jgi:glycosyltransferase involved in cell wall biosynthesis
MSDETKRMEPPFFSIIIPTFNCLSKLESTMASIFEQNFGNFECLLLDGGSTDGTREYSAGLAERDIRVLSSSEADKGIYDAMNKGIRRGRGKFLYFIGAGDCLKGQALDAVARHLSGQPQRLPILLYGDVFWVSESRVYGGVSGRFRLAQFNICHQGIFYDRRIFAMLGEYTTSYSLFADWVLNMKCFSNPGIAKLRIDSIIADYAGNGASQGNPDPVFHRDRIYLILRYLGIFPLVGLVWARVFELVCKRGMEMRRRMQS